MTEEEATAIVEAAAALVDPQTGAPPAIEQICAAICEAKTIIGCHESPPDFPDLCLRLIALQHRFNCECGD